MKIIWKNLKGKTYLLALYCVMSAGTAVLDVGLAYVMSVCVDVATGERTGSLRFYGGFFLLYIAVFFVVYDLYRILLYKIEQLVKQRLRRNVLEQLYSERRKQQKNAGEWISLLTTDINTINESYVEVILCMLPEILSMAVSIVLMVAVSPVLFVLVLGITAIQMLLPKYVGGALGRRQESYSASAEEFSKVLSEHLQAMDTMESFGAEHFSEEILLASAAKLEQKKYTVQCLRSNVQMTAVTLGNFSYIGVFFVGAALILRGEMTLGTLIGASQLMVYISGPMQTISQSLSDIRGGRQILMKVLRETGDEDETAKKRKGCAERETGAACGTGKARETGKEQTAGKVYDARHLQLDDVSFSYGSGKILDHANYTFVRGQHYLLQAPSGSGKSTLAAILAGKQSPQSGSVRTDGEDISRLDKAERTRICAACPQSPFIFQDTLKNNVTLYNNAYSDDEVFRALEDVGLGGRMLGQVLEPAGKNFSGGELQRISLARLYLLHTNFVVLDESMANLDMDTALQLLTSMLAATDKTIIYISHQEDERLYALFEHIITIRDQKIREMK